MEFWNHLACFDPNLPWATHPIPSHTHIRLEQRPIKIFTRMRVRRWRNDVISQMHPEMNIMRDRHGHNEHQLLAERAVSASHPHSSQRQRMQERTRHFMSTMSLTRHSFPLLYHGRLRKTAEHRLKLGKIHLFIQLRELQLKSQEDPAQSINCMVPAKLSTPL